MNPVLSVLIALALFQSCDSDQTLVKFVRNYYNAYNIHQISLLACWDQKDAAHISQSIMGLDTTVIYLPITPDADLKKVLHANHNRMGVLLDFDCSFSEHVLQKLSTQLVFNESYHWIILTTSATIPTEFLKGLTLTIESEVTVVLRSKTATLFQFYDVYNINYRRDSAITIAYKGHWMPESGLISEMNQYKYKRRGDFKGSLVNFSLVLLHNPLPDLYTYLTHNIKNTHLDNISRAHYNFILYLRDMFNFSINITHTNSWGYLVNGTFNGLIGDILAGHIDMSASPFLFDQKRLEILDYTVATWIGDAGFIFRHPTSSNLRNNFLKPFSNDLWIIISIIAITYSLFLFFSLKIEWHYTSGMSQYNSILLPASETSLTTLAALSQQGVSSGPSIFSGRIIFLSLLIWSLLLYQFYSASIVSCLLRPPPRWIKTIGDLTDSAVDVGCQNTAYFSNFFGTTTDPTHRALNERKLKPTKKRPQGSYYTMNEGMEKVKKGGFAFITDNAASYRIIGDTFSEDEICELQEVKPTKPRRLWLVIAKNSPLKKMMIYGLRKIAQSGLMTHAQQVWRAPYPQCPETHKSKPTPLGMSQFSPALFLLLIGVGTSVAVLSMECIYYCCSKETDSVEANSENIENEDNRNMSNSPYLGHILFDN